MSDWRNFLGDLGEDISEAWNTLNNEPGQVMICFVNRYLEGLDGVKYKIEHNRKVISEAKTTPNKYCITVSPTNFQPIDIFVWSRVKNTYKKLDNVVPNVGSKKLVRKILKTYKADGRTEPHAKNTRIAPPPPKPAAAPAPGPSPTDKQGVKPTPVKDESGLSKTDVERAVPDKITKEQLKKIFVKAELVYLQQIADELNKDLPKYKLDTAVRRAHFFGQVRQETGTTASGGAESLSHTPERLIKVFGYYKNHKPEAQQDGRLEKPVPGKKKVEVTQAANQEVIANKVYGTGLKATRLGNKEPGDGWKYRGRGLKQTTGKGNYANFIAAHKKYWGEEIDFVANPDLVAQHPYSVRSAVVFWLTKKCWEAADKGMNDAAIDAVTKIVNSGEITIHLSGDYQANNNPVLNRRKFARLAYAAFT